MIKKKLQRVKGSRENEDSHAFSDHLCIISRSRHVPLLPQHQYQSLRPGSHKWKPLERWQWFCVNMPEPNSFLGMEQILVCRKPGVSSCTDLHWVSTWFWSTCVYASYQYHSWLYSRDMENFLTMEEVRELLFLLNKNKQGAFALRFPEILMYTQRVALMNSINSGL